MNSHLSIPALTENLARLRAWLAEEMRSVGCSPEEIEEMMLAADEAATNIILHGYRQPEGEIEIDVEAEAGALRVRFRDHAPPFDPTRVPPRDVDRALAQGQPGGMGIDLIRRVTDEMTYRQTPQGENELTLVRRRAGARRTGSSEELSSPPSTPSEREWQIAREIQASFLVKAIPQPDGWEIAARFEPARQVAGDFYDVFPLVENRRLGLVIADVSGKGVGAALFMALIRSLVRALAQQHYTVDWHALLDRRGPNRHALPHVGAMALQNAVTMTNEYLIANHAAANMFATLFFGVLDPTNGTLMYVNAGHNEPIIAGPAGIKTKLAPTGPAIGFISDAEFAIQEARIAPGDLLLCYTDGVTEAFSPDRDLFGEERLDALLAPPLPPSAGTVLDRVDNAVRQFSQGGEQNDDITMLAVQRREGL
jgi:phosphoserine phosphatase RsbU/P